MGLINIKVGCMDNNCYLLSDQDKNAVCIDPGAEWKKIAGKIEEENLNLSAILITHAHFDHILALEGVYSRFDGVKLYVTQKQAEALKNPDINLSAMAHLKPYVCSLPMEIISGSLKTGQLDIEIMETPGHTEDSVCFYVENKLFSGDTLFAGTVGRTDFPGGNMKVLERSLEMLKTLPGNTVVFAGHGDSTTIEHEVKYNPFMQRI